MVFDLLNSNEPREHMIINKKNSEIKLKVSTELLRNLNKISKVMNIKRPQLVRAILNDRVTIILSDLMSRKGVSYTFREHNLKETLVRNTHNT